MIVNERYLNILNLLNDKKSITISEIVNLLNISESTVRRDLNALDKQKKLIKVHGGAISNKISFITEEETLINKQSINVNEKKDIAKKAASLVNPKDFVYIDCGTTTYEIVNFLTEKNATYVTNSVSIASNLTQKGFNIFMLGGKIKQNTNAVIGSFAKEYIKKFNFNIGFFGTNGVSLKNGYTTPDIEEAEIKELAISKTHIPFVLLDSSKFNLAFSVTFSDLKDAYIITNKCNNNSISDFKKQTKILEV